jgi:adenine specific DNA methylase Mod
MLDKYVAKDNENTAYLIIEEEAVVIKDNIFYGLNSVANFIWKLADGKTKVEQIIEKICQEFEVDWHTAEKECLEFLNDLISHHLVILSQNPVEG